MNWLLIIPPFELIDVLKHILFIQKEQTNAKWSIKNEYNFNELY